MDSFTRSSLSFDVGAAPARCAGLAPLFSSAHLVAEKSALTSLSGRPAPNIPAVTADRSISSSSTWVAVLIQPGGVASMRALAASTSDEALWPLAGLPLGATFRAGLCSPEEFADGMVADWDLPLEPAAFLEEFSGWPLPPFEGAPRTRRAVAGRRAGGLPLGT